MVMDLTLLMPILMVHGDLAFDSQDSIPVWPDYLNAFPELFPSSGNIKYRHNRITLKICLKQEPFMKTPLQWPVAMGKIHLVQQYLV